MKASTILIVIGALVVLSRPRATVAPLAARQSNLATSTDWGSDQWARIYGADMPPTDAQSPHLPYGLSTCQCTGFNT